MKRALVLAVAAVGLFLLGRALVHSLVSDETKIRWVIEDMAEGFDDTRMDPILNGLSQEFQDETTGAGRQDLRQALAYLFFTAKNDATKGFPYRAEVSIARIEVSREAPRLPEAVCELSVRFLEKRESEERLAWEIEVTARLERGDHGWTIRSTAHSTRSGRMLR